MDGDCGLAAVAGVSGAATSGAGQIDSRKGKTSDPCDFDRSSCGPVFLSQPDEDAGYTGGITNQPALRLKRRIVGGGGTKREHPVGTYQRELGWMSARCLGWEHVGPFKFAGGRPQSRSTLRRRCAPVASATHYTTYSLESIHWRMVWAAAASDGECNCQAVPTFKARHPAVRVWQRIRIVLAYPAVSSQTLAILTHERPLDFSPPRGAHNLG